MNAILAIDCGSTTTKAVLIVQKDGLHRLAGSAQSPTTVEAPYEDVMVGVWNSLEEAEALTGRHLVEGERLIRPGDSGRGVDLFVSTSSAGGGLQMVVAGVVGSMSSESAARAALGAGAIVTGVLSVDDGRESFERAAALKDWKPDMVLLAGGTDGGTVAHVASMAEVIRAADPKPRFGTHARLPVIFAGNQEASAEVLNILGSVCEIETVPNLRPVLEREDLHPARETIHDFFLEHVMARAPGYERLMEMVDGEILPTPAAVGFLVRALSERRSKNVMAVDIGGATTDVFSVFRGAFNRSVSANLGMSYSASNVLEEAGHARILRWLPFDMEREELENKIMNKTIRPTVIPQTVEDLSLEQAVAREALRLSFEQHRELAVSLKGVQQQRTIGDTFSQSRTGASLVDLTSLDLLIASGGCLSHAPRRQQAMAMVLDAFQLEGITEVMVDNVFMMPHLGVLASVDEDIALAVMEKDCLVPLGTVVAPRGRRRGEGWALRVVFRGSKSPPALEIPWGEIAVVPLEPGSSLQAEIQPRSPLDLGEGRGKPVRSTLRGGEVGLVFDARGRPLPEEPPDGAMSLWLERLGALT